MAHPQNPNRLEFLQKPCVQLHNKLVRFRRHKRHGVHLQDPSCPQTNWRPHPNSSCLEMPESKTHCMLTTTRFSYLDSHPRMRIISMERKNNCAHFLILSLEQFFPTHTSCRQNQVVHILPLVSYSFPEQVSDRTPHA